MNTHTLLLALTFRFLSIACEAIIKVTLKAICGEK